MLDQACQLSINAGHLLSIIEEKLYRFLGQSLYQESSVSCIAVAELLAGVLRHIARCILSVAVASGQNASVCEDLQYIGCLSLVGVATPGNVVQSHHARILTFRVVLTVQECFPQYMTKATNADSDWKARAVGACPKTSQCKHCRSQD